MSDSLIIIPTYKEKENIENIIRCVFALEKQFDILVIDDNSPDGTAGIVKNLIKEFPERLFIEERKGKLGLGTAYLHGFKWALNKDYEYVFEMDADFSHPPKKLIELYDALKNKGADVAVGSRYVDGKISVVNWPIGRVIMSYYASVYVRLVLGMKTGDTTAGFVGYKRKVLETIKFDKVKFVGYAFQVEMKYTAFRLGFKIVEVPIIFTDRVLGQSKMSMKIFKEAFFGVFNLKFRNWKKIYPIILLLLCCTMFSLKAQDTMEINKLMTSYKIQRNVYSAKFVDNDTYSYYDKNYTKHTIDKKGKDRIEEYEKEESQIPKDAKYVEKGKIASAYILKDNLYIHYHDANKEDKQITFDGDSLNIIIGQSVHRNEFGIEKGLFFSDNGQYLAYYRMDQSMVRNYPLVNTMTREAEYTPMKYPMAGMKSHEVEVYVLNIGTGEKNLILTRKDTSLNERENYLTNLSFSADGKTLYIQKLNRKQNHLWLEAYNSDNGVKKRVVLEQTSNKYVEPEHPIVFLPKDDSKFIFFSEKDGFMHLYIYDTNGTFIKQLTKGQWIVNDIAGFNDKGTECYFYATKDSPLERNFYGVNLKDGRITRYTPEHGTHYVSFAPNGKKFIDSYYSLDVAWRTVIYDNKGNVIKELEKCEDPLDKLSNKPQIIVDTIHAHDGTVLYTRMIRPKDFNPNIKYPVLIYVYNGPHAQLITDSWTAGAGLFLPYLATKGYIVWTLDGRGSDNRGYDFESAIWRQCGTQEIADQMEGVKHLKSLPYVDSTRIGVDGWSYGGFMTLGLTLRNPGVFKVATAGGPVIDWKWYEIMYGERYMSSPQDNPEGYKKASLLNYIDNIPDDARILIFQGYQDNTVVPQHSLEFIRMCVEKKKPVDYFMYTKHEHNVRGIDRTELYKKQFRYYEDFLK